MEQFKEALNRGKQVRKLQDESLALFVELIQNVDDIQALENIKAELKGGRL